MVHPRLLRRGEAAARVEARAQAPLDALDDLLVLALDRVEQAYQLGEMGRPHLDRTFGKKLMNISSAAFGGPDMQTVYLGCLLGEELVSFRAPVAGLKPFHWEWTA